MYCIAWNITDELYENTTALLYWIKLDEWKSKHTSILNHFSNISNMYLDILDSS